MFERYGENREMTRKLILQCFKNSKYFSRTTLACYQLFCSKMISQIRAVPFHLLLITFAANIHAHSKPLCQLLGTESEVCQSGWRIYFKKEGFDRTTRTTWVNRNSSGTTARHSDNIVKLVLVLLTRRIRCSHIQMLLHY